MKFKPLKETYPQKFCLKTICKFLYYIGCGDCWYEETTRSKFERIVYPLWATLSNSYVVIGTINELAAHFIDLSPQERNDLLQHSIAHPTNIMKVCALYMQRNRIKIMLKKFLEDTRLIYSSPEIDKAAVKKGLNRIIALGVVLYCTLIFTLLDAVRAHYAQGLPFRVEVIFFPRPGTHSGIFWYILQFFVEFHWWYIVAHVLLIDGLSICSLVFLEAKYILLQSYFLNLRNIYMENTEGKTQKELDDEFRKGFIVGIKLHEDALWSATNVQHALGNVYSVQIIQSITLFGICINKLVISEHTLVLMVATSLYVACMVLMTGSYMIIAGDVAYEAAKLPTAIFHCGWEHSHSLRELRSYIVLAMQRSQAPVEMTAFGIVILSYENFITILRSSYSFCAVML